MPDYLTAKRFEEFVELFTEKHGEIRTILDDHTARFDRIEHRLDAIEKMLWQGDRLDELERRVRAVAEQIGRPDLATPLQRPMGA